jgi:hypothetical protein
MTKPGSSTHRDVPFNATSGSARADFGFLKLENRIEAGDPSKITRRPIDASGGYKGHRGSDLVLTPKIKILS